MGINVGIGSDPGSQGAVNFESTGGVSSTSPVAAPSTMNILELSTLAQSESTSSSTSPNAASPVLSASVNTVAVLAFDIANSQAAAVNAVLDNWTKQIEIQNEISAENNKRNIIKENVIKQQLNEYDIEQANIKENQLNEQTTGSVSMSAGSNFNEWWNNASSVEKSNYLNTNGDRMIGAYLDTHNDAVIQNSDLAKGGIPAFIETMKEVLVVNPMASDLAMRSSNLFSSGGAVADELNNLQLPASLSDIPQINLFLPGVMYNSALGATLGLYLRRGAGNQDSDEAVINQKFVEELAKKTLQNTEYTDSWLRAKQPGFSQLTQEQQQSVVTAANLLALTTVLIFDVKAQGQASNLSPEEYASMLKNGNPEDPLLNTVLGKINVMFAELEKSKPDEAKGYKDFVNNFIVAAGVNRFNIDDLKDFAKVLLYANNTIGEAERVVKRTA